MDKVDVEERKRMFDLMKDRELGGNMDWMYRGDKTDAEEFLLGKSVDKLLTEATSSMAEEGGTSIISERIKANVALDMQAKMREDPLFAIRKKEEEARRRLLENPVKMKQLERLLEQQKQQQKSNSSKKAKKEKKKNKKKKKKRHGSDSSDSDSSDSEDDLVNQYLTILTQKKKSGHSENAKREHKHPRGNVHRKNFYQDRPSDIGEDHRRHRDNHRDGGRQRGDDRDFVKSRKSYTFNRNSRRNSESPPRQQKKDRSSSRESEPESHGIQQRRSSGDREVSERVYGLIKSVRHGMAAAGPPPEVKVKSESSKRSRSSSSPEDTSRATSAKHLNSRKQRDRSSSPKHPRSNRKRSSSRSRSRSPVRKRNFSPPRRQRSKSPPRKRRSRSPPKKKLTAEEREKKLQEMMDNAKWRDEQRVKNVQRYKKEDEKETSRLNKYQGDAEFLNSMMSAHAANSSVEDRLKRNKYNIQRTTAALNKNFTQH